MGCGISWARSLFPPRTPLVKRYYVLSCTLFLKANCLYNTQEIELWHHRLGHLNRKYVQRLRLICSCMDFRAKNKHRIDYDKYVKSSQKRQISRFPTQTPPSVLEIIYTDICGPMQENDFWGYRYFALFVCAKSRFKFIYLLFTKDGITLTFRTFKS